MHRLLAFEPTASECRRYFESRLRGRRLGSKAQVNVRCCFHDDKTASLSLNLAKGVWNCKACDNKGGGILDFERKMTGRSVAECWTAIFATIGREDWPPPAKSVAYDYHDADGRVVYQAVRMEPKKFFQRQPDGKGGWIMNMSGVTRVLFNLPAVIKSDVVLIAEGEKDVLNLHRAATSFPDGLVYAATTNVGGAGKWHDSYSVHLKGKKVFIFGDNDDPGREHVRQVALSVAKEAASVHLVEMPDLKDKGDVSDYLTEHTESELFALIQAARAWTPGTDLPPIPVCRETVWETAENMSTFLSGEEEMVIWLIVNVLASACLTQIFAPRGLGKSVLMLFWAVTLARAGKRVLLLDKDNPRSTVRSRLISLGGEGLENLKVLTRDRCPYLTSKKDWLTFPFDAYDVVIVDSWNSLTPGVAEKDTAASGLALQPLLEVVARGAAVLIIGNTVRSAAHSRVNGVVEDRADFIFEVRDGTDFRPTGKKPWVEELVSQGASDWQARSSRRRGRTKQRLALVPTKTRIGPELEPRMLEINFDDEPWLVSDVTADVDAEGERIRQDMIREQKELHGRAVELLTREIERRAMTGESIKKEAAEKWLVRKGELKREPARNVTNDPAFEVVQGVGKGNPKYLRLSAKYSSSAEILPSQTPSVYADFKVPDFRRPLLEHTAEIDPSENLVNCGDFEPAISAVEINLAGRPKTNGDIGRSEDLGFRFRTFVNGFDAGD